MYLKDNIVIFYGSKAGRLENGTIYIHEKFKCGETIDTLSKWGYPVVWEKVDNYQQT